MYVYVYIHTHTNFQAALYIYIYSAAWKFERPLQKMSNFNKIREIIQNVLFFI